MHIYFWILNLGNRVIFYFLNYFLCGHFLIFKKHYFAFFFNYLIDTNNSAKIHFKENKITYSSLLVPRDRPLCSA
ncbi:hypothetical protein TSAR_015566 [Trichomalopsis sarcophagae]|uniref:Uncharacterized protein n=1 Tax=Trichomalopsis sarcophagae TaxID=543379 RepID=A0A232EPD8_9HYME|nr:hypothetical protein TSAR_015566 [Trichomalopsis sarcophagae]